MPPKRKDYDVFLSHNSADKPNVEVLARRLEDETATETLPPLIPFLDKWHLIPGDPWQEALEQALDSSDTCAVFIGPKGLGPWHNEEMRSALDERVGHPEFRVVPVLLPGATLPERGQLPRFLRRLTWVDFRTEGLNDVTTFHRLVAGIRGVPPGRKGAVLIDAVETLGPYRGLEVFDEAHARFFFGREADTQHLVETLQSTQFLAVVGPSGSGKSSLVRAGLLPQLRVGALPQSKHWRYSIFKPGVHPLEALAMSLAQVTQRTDTSNLLDHLEKDERELHLAVRLALHGQQDTMRVCLVVDQFEEVFTLCQNQTERQCLINALRYAATVAGGQTVVVVTLRADFVARVTEYPPLAELFSSHQFLVSPLEAEDLRHAMEEPARLVGARLEDGLAEQMLHDTGREPGALPLLEHALLRLWKQRRADNVLTFAAYSTIGGVQGALANHANAVFAELSPTEQGIARRMLLRLTQIGEGTENTRRRATFGELQTQGEEKSAIETVVKTLTDARLLVTSGDQKTDEIDVAHEALIRGWPLLRGWVEESRSALQTHRRVTEATQEWQRLGRDEGALFRGARLSVAQKWREQNELDLNDSEKEFLDASIKLMVSEEEKEKIQHRREEYSLWARWILASTIGLAVFVAVFRAVFVPLFEVMFVPVFEAMGGAVSGAMGGIILGFAQWFVLKHQFSRAGWWVLATTVGGAVFGAVVVFVGRAVFVAVFVAVGEAVGKAVGVFVNGAMGGIILGFAQWFVLKHQFSRAGWWVLATTVGGAVFVAMVVGVGVGGTMSETIGGLIYGTISGRVLIWLLRRPIVKQ